jgi:hypothetical protein
MTRAFISNQIMRIIRKLDEHYFKMNKELFTGEFILINDSVKEVRKIKDGLRHGKTIFIDINSNKVVQKETYKKGIKK